MLWHLIAKTSPLFSLRTWEAFAIAACIVHVYNPSPLAYSVHTDSETQCTYWCPKALDDWLIDCDTKSNTYRNSGLLWRGVAGHPIQPHWICPWCTCCTNLMLMTHGYISLMEYPWKAWWKGVVKRLILNTRGFTFPNRRILLWPGKTQLIETSEKCVCFVDVSKIVWWKVNHMKLV